MTKLRNPYPGIRPFRTGESHLFFGREKNISELREKLTCRFLSIVGTSGSGKSSLVRAGLIPSLLNDDCFVATFRPQNEPIKNLISALISEEGLGKFLPKNFMEGLDPDKDWQITDYYQASGQENPLVLVVDQFEEIFRFGGRSSKDKAIAARFVDLLLNAIEQTDSKIFVVITLRSEFLGRCAEFHGLTEWINKGQYLVPRLSAEQFERVITGFRDLEEYRDVEVSQELVSKLLNDIGDDMDQLPVLQHSLMRTWYEWEKNGDKMLDLEHYHVTGEMTASVSNHAEDILKELKYQGLEREARLIFQRITEIDPESNKVRNPTQLETLIELSGGKRNEVLKIIDAFRQEGRNFLLPDFEVDLEADTMIDVAHESLIRQWRTLGKWMREEAENAREYKLINQRRENQETEGLLLNPRLAISNYWWLAKSPSVTWASRYHNLEEYASKADHRRIFSLNEEFLEASLEEQEKIDEANKTEKERRKEQQFQRITYLTVGLVVVALILGLFSRRNQVLRDNAVESARVATEEAREAEEARLIAVNATEQAIREKSIADSLRGEANKKAYELIQANLVADNLKNQAFEEREIAVNRSIDARLAEIGALISESRAKANEIEANILKLSSEYKEQIEQAKKQALVSIIMDDAEEQKENALTSYEKFDRYNTLLMGLTGPENRYEDRTIDYYVESIDSVRINLANILNRANNWIREFDTSLPQNHNTFRLNGSCDLSISLYPTTVELVHNKLDSLGLIKSSFETTCISVNQIRTEREWERAYPVENHRALLESYSNTFPTFHESIDFDELTSFINGSIEIHFNVKNSPEPIAPKYLATKGLNRIAYSRGFDNISIIDGGRNFNIPLEEGMLKYIHLLDDNRVVFSNLGKMFIYDYQEEGSEPMTLENGENIIGFKSTSDAHIGLNTNGEILIWNQTGELINQKIPLSEGKVTSFDCMKHPASDSKIFALGTDNGRVHLVEYTRGSFEESGIQLNRLYSGEEPSVKTMKFSPNGQFLATSSSRQLDLWALAVIDETNGFQSIFSTEIESEQISPVPMGRDDNIQTSKGLTGISFDKNGDFLMFTNNGNIIIKPVNLRFMCQSLGSEYCSQPSVN